MKYPYVLILVYTLNAVNAFTLHDHVPSSVVFYDDDIHKEESVFSLPTTKNFYTFASGSLSGMRTTFSKG